MPNKVLLVTVDSIRSDHQKHLSNTSDFLRFEERPVFATAAATYSSFQSIVGGHYPSEHGVQRTVAERFDEQSIGITTNNFLSSTYGFDSGFDYFNSPKSDMSSGWKSKVGMMLNPGSRRHEIAVRAWNRFQSVKSKIPLLSVSRDFRDVNSVIDEFEKAKKNNEEWFAWIHLMEPHHPYNPPNSDLRRVEAKSISRQVRSATDSTNSKEEQARSLYKNEVKWVDSQLERLWDSLSEDTKVVFCSDHGEYLGQNNDNYWGHGGELKPVVLKVPLGYKGLTTPNGDLVSLIDIPTILLDGVEYGNGKMERSYAYATSEGSKAVFSKDGYRNKNGCFDYEGNEISNEKLENKYEEFDAGESSRMDAGVEEDLRALGYLD